VEVDILISRDDGLPILGAATRKVFPVPTESLADLKDVETLDEMVRKEVASWGVEEADEKARVQLSLATFVAEEVKKLDATVATGRTLALVAVAVKPLVKDVK
jgi:hypothetical protein